MKRKKRLRLSTVALVVAAVITGTMLFRVSERVQTAEHNLAQMESAAAKEAETIRVLRAEWAYLNRPDRLEALAAKHLKMDQPGIQQVLVDSGDLPPQPTPVDLTLPVSLEQPQPQEPRAIPPLPRLKPRHDTKSFQALLNELQPTAGGPE
ncbi:MAG: hypothetical protein KJ667_00930 [Alphaproteobacteria bacterium]|nr:hypothetical protein [Alphaproteobacteria bacterium]